MVSVSYRSCTVNVYYYAVAHVLRYTCIYATSISELNNGMVWTLVCDILFKTENILSVFVIALDVCLCFAMKIYTHSTLKTCRNNILAHWSSTYQQQISEFVTMGCWCYLFRMKVLWKLLNHHVVVMKILQFWDNLQCGAITFLGMWSFIA